MLGVEKCPAHLWKLWDFRQDCHYILSKVEPHHDGSNNITLTRKPAVARSNNRGLCLTLPSFQRFLKVSTHSRAFSVLGQTQGALSTIYCNANFPRNVSRDALLELLGDGAYRSFFEATKLFLSKYLSGTFSPLWIWDSVTLSHYSLFLPEP